MQIGLRLPSAGRIQDVVATARQAEAAGLDMVWLPDSPLNYREVWSVLGAISVSTNRIGLGPMVTNFSSRHLTVTAAAAGTISEAAPGRFAIGVGAGDSAVGFDTMRPATVAQMEDGVVKLRALMAGEPVAYGDFHAKLRDAHQSPPILIAASGPRTQRMAGRVGDGAVLPMGRIEQKIEGVLAGAAEAGLPRPKMYAALTCAAGEEPDLVLRRAKLHCMRMAQLEGVGMFEQAGFKIEGEFLAHKMGAHGDIGHSANVAETAKMAEGLISDEIATWYVKEHIVTGSTDEVAARLRGLADLGLTGAYLSQQEGSVLPNRLIEILSPVLKQLHAA